MGRPSFPTRAEQEQLRGAAQLPPPESRPLLRGGIVKLELMSHSLALIEVVK
jgi:hypothetical protein